MNALRCLVVVMLISVFGLTGICQEQTDVFSICEVMPQFPGGEKAMANYFRDNVNYPELSRLVGAQGVSYVQFIILEDGSIDRSTVKVAKSAGPLLDAEAIRVIRAMPNWYPGLQRDKPVKVQMTQPVRFILENPTLKNIYDWEWPSSGDTNRSLDDTDSIFFGVDQLPTFPGGEVGINAYISRYIKYPKSAVEQRITGTVVVQFNVMDNGWVDTAHITIVQSVHQLLDDEATRLISEMPRWIPGQDKGKIKPVAMQIPIIFYLKD